MSRNYLPYRGYAHQIHQLARAEGVRVDMHAELLCQAKVANAQRHITTGDLAIWECAHYTLSHKVVNLSRNIGERFLASNMRLRANQLRLPYTLFEVCFERGFMVPGLNVQMPSALVLIQADDALLKSLKSLWGNIGNEDIDLVNLRRMFSVNYLDPFNSERSCHANIDTARHDGQSIDEMIRTSSPLSESDPEDGTFTPMSDRDTAAQRAVMTAVLATLCYMNTANPDVKDFKFPDRPHFSTLPPRAVEVGGGFDRMPPGWHLRQAHFRMLRNERFRRDKDGGARVIWVREAEVRPGQQPAGHALKEVTLEGERKGE